MEIIRTGGWLREGAIDKAGFVFGLERIKETALPGKEIITTFGEWLGDKNQSGVIGWVDIVGRLGINGMG